MKLLDTETLAKDCQDVILEAEIDDIKVTDDNVISLLFNTLTDEYIEPISVTAIKNALVNAGFRDRFPKSCERRFIESFPDLCEG